MKLSHLFIAAALAVLTACGPTDFAERSETVERSFTVRDIDRANRSFAVVGGGQRFNLKVSDAIVNFDQIEVGDEVLVEYIEAVAVGMADPSDTGETYAVDGVVVAPEGAKPGIAGADVVSTVVEFVSYDPSSKVAVVRLPDQSIYATKVSREMRRFAAARVPGDRIAVDIATGIAVAIVPAG